jgi:streptogramin lyase
VVIASGVVTTLAGTAGMSGSSDGTGANARFNGPYGVAADNSGNLFVADSGNDTIRQVVIATGEVTTLAGSASMAGSSDGTGANARFNGPYGVAVDNAGNVYLADTGNHTLRKLSLENGGVTTLAGLPGQAGVKLGPVPARLNSPSGLAVQPAGTIYIAEARENAVLIVH